LLEIQARISIKRGASETATQVNIQVTTCLAPLLRTSSASSTSASPSPQTGDKLPIRAPDPDHLNLASQEQDHQRSSMLDENSALRKPVYLCWHRLSLKNRLVAGYLA
jgi:hypothetical protein